MAVANLIQLLDFLATNPWAFSALLLPIYLFGALLYFYTRSLYFFQLCYTTQGIILAFSWNRGCQAKCIRLVLHSDIPLAPCCFRLANFQPLVAKVPNYPKCYKLLKAANITSIHTPYNRFIIFSYCPILAILNSDVLCCCPDYLLLLLAIFL